MSKLYSFKTGKEVTFNDVNSLFTKGMPIYMISYILGIFQIDCAHLLGTH